MHIVLLHFYSSTPNPVYQELSSALTRRGHRVWIGQPSPEGGFILKENGKAVKIINPSEFGFGLRGPALLSRIVARFKQAKLLLRIRRILRQAHPDVVQVNLTSYAWILPFRHRQRTHFVSDVRQINENDSGTVWRRFRAWLVITEMRANASYFFEHACFCHAGAAKRILGQNWSRRGSVVPVAVDQAFLAQPNKNLSAQEHDRPVRFVYVGTLGRGRNLERLIDSCRILLEMGAKFELDFIGPDSADGYYHRWIEARGLHPFVRIRPALDYRHVPAALHSYDVGLAYVPDRPTWHYQPAIKVLEYRALGLPIISTDVASHREFVKNEVNGLLVSDNESAWATAMARFAQEPALLQECCRNARGMRVGLTWDDVARMYEELVYVRLLN